MTGNSVQSIISEISDLRNVALYTSGGADSTLLLYLLCTKLKEVTAVHITDINRPYGIINFEEILWLFKEEFPEVNIKTYFNSYDQKITGHKSRFFRQVDTDLLKNYGIDNIVYGTTKNPPLDISRKYNLIEGRDFVREYRVLKDKRYHLPLNEVDKRFVAECYSQNLFLKKVFPLTISCIEKVGPCKKCWWCREKKWAFGVHDGESVV